MNRRKLFGILAAAPAAAVAASAAKPDYAQLMDIYAIPKPMELWCRGESPLFKSEYKPKCYSTWNYNSILSIFVSEYKRKKHGLSTDALVFVDVNDREDTVYDYMSKEWVGLGCYTSLSEVIQAFADACLNGEVPGVWWE